MRADVLQVLEGLKERHAKVYENIVENNYSDVDFDPKDVDGKDILDLGAHIGTFSLFCLMHGARSVLSVEANPNTFKELSSNTPFSEINILNRAVTGGTAPYVMMSDRDAHSSVVKENGTLVPTATIDELVGIMPKGNDRLLKIDIEGCEYEALPFASAKTIRSFKTIFLETHKIDDTGPGKNCEFLKEHLEAMGYVENKKTQIFYWEFDAEGNATSCTPIPNTAAWRFDLEEQS